MFEATGQQEFDFPVAVQVRNFHSLATWLGQSPFNSAQSINERFGRYEFKYFSEGLLGNGRVRFCKSPPGNCFCEYGCHCRKLNPASK